MRTSPQQFEVLVQYMEKYGDLNNVYNGFKMRSRIATVAHWSRITHKLNNQSGGFQKSKDRWKKVWSDFKNNTRRKQARLQKAKSSPPGEAREASVKITDLEQRVLNIVNQSKVWADLRAAKINNPSCSLPAEMLMDADDATPEAIVEEEVVDETNETHEVLEPGTDSQAADNSQIIRIKYEEPEDIDPLLGEPEMDYISKQINASLLQHTYARSELEAEENQPPPNAARQINGFTITTSEIEQEEDYSAPPSNAQQLNNTLPRIIITTSEKEAADNHSNGPNGARQMNTSHPRLTIEKKHSLPSGAGRFKTLVLRPTNITSDVKAKANHSPDPSAARQPNTSLVKRNNTTYIVKVKENHSAPNGAGRLQTLLLRPTNKPSEIEADRKHTVKMSAIGLSNASNLTRKNATFEVETNVNRSHPPSTSQKMFPILPQSSRDITDEDNTPSNSKRPRRHRWRPADTISTIQSKVANSLLLNSERKWRSFLREREKRQFELEMERLRLREMELQQQAQWQRLFGRFISVLNQYVDNQH